MIRLESKACLAQGIVIVAGLHEAEANSCEAVLELLRL